MYRVKDFLFKFSILLTEGSNFYHRSIYFPNHSPSNSFLMILSLMHDAIES